MNKMAWTAAFTLAALTTIGTASAQNFTTSVPTRWGFRLGAFFPANSAAQDEGDVWLAAGVDYKLARFTPKSVGEWKGDVSLSFDYYQRNDFQALPVLVNYTAYFEKGGYITGGIGVAFNREPTAFDTRSETKFAYSIGVGYDTHLGTQPVFVEGRWWGNSNSRLNGFAVYAGVRF